MGPLSAMPALGRLSVAIVGHDTRFGEMVFFPSWHGTAEHPVCRCLLQVNNRQRTTATPGKKKETRSIDKHRHAHQQAAHCGNKGNIEQQQENDMQQPTIRSSHKNIRKHSDVHSNNEIVTMFLSRKRW